MANEIQDAWQTLEVPGYDLEMKAYTVRPDDGAAHPSLIIIHEAFGLDPHIQDVTRRLAQEGYFAVAPDLFSLDPFGRTVQPQEVMRVFGLRSSLPPERRRDPAAMEEAIAQLPAGEAARMRDVVAWTSRRDPTALVSPLEQTVSWAREQSESTDAAGAIGFCFGGGMTLQLAFAGAPIDAAAPFYGSNPPLERANQVRCPLLLVYGRNDPFIMPGVPALLGAVQEAGLTYEMHIYEEAGHAFLNDARPEAYNQRAAEDAWQKVTSFFGRHLA